MRILIAIVASGTLMWGLAGAFHAMYSAFFVAEGGAPEGGHQGVGLILIFYLLLASFVALAFHAARFPTDAIKRGLAVGIFVGLLWVLPHGLVIAAAHGKSLSYELRNALWHVVEQGLGGLAYGLMFARRR